MALGSVPCSCGGENSNCYRCFGSGMLESKAGKKSPWKGTPPKSRSDGGSRQVQRQEVPHSAKELVLWVICPQCGVLLKKLDGHQCRVHGGASTPPSVLEPVLKIEPVAPATPQGSIWERGAQRVLQPCPVCKVLVKSLTKHAQKTGHAAQKGLSNQHFQPVARGLPQTGVDIVKCRYCQRTFPDDVLLASHVHSIHGLQKLHSLGMRSESELRPPPSKISFTKVNNAQARQNGSATGSRSSEPNRSNGDAGLSVAKNLDAKYGWGGTYRDNGQFGSYPSHDGMDDESFP